MDNNYKTIEELEARRNAREAMRAVKKKKKKRLRRITLCVFIAAVILAGAGFCGYLAYREINGIGGDDKMYVVEVPAGAGASNVANLLANRGIIDYPFLFRLYAGDRYMFQQGRHSVSPSMSYNELLETFGSYAEGGVGEQVEVVIPEGYELSQIADLLVEKGLVDRDEFMNEINYGVFDYDFVNLIPRSENRLEGYLYPATYQIYPGTSVHDIILMMLDAFNSNVMPAYNASGTTDSVDYVVTFASVIEREAANTDEMRLVSSVFNNRLYDGRKLESCATVQYILGERKPVLSEEDTEIDSPYNTYMYEGLPYGPICSPSRAAVRAALNPAQTSYMYFVAAPDGSKNYFSQTFDEHEEKIELLNNGMPVDESTPTPAPTAKADD